MQRIVLSLMLFMPVLASAQPGEAPGNAQPLSERMSALEQRLDKLEGAPANASISSFNPAMGMALDMVARDHNDKADFQLRAAEVNLEAAVDPFLKAWAIITGSNNGISLEEAAAQTTSLPYGLTVRGGRVFAPFGRFSAWHDHELPMIDRPNSLFSYVGAESHADGLDAAYLFPTPFFLEGIAGVYNGIGADNNRIDNTAARSLNEWTYLGRLHGYGDLTDSTGLDLGLSEAWTPKNELATFGPSTSFPEPLNKSWRALSGVDLTFRYQPSVGGLYKGLVWTTEALQNQERVYSQATGSVLGRGISYSGYSNVETKLGRVVRLGGFADVTELPSNSKQVTQTYAGYLTFEITEFNRIRLQYSRILNNYPGTLSTIPGTDFGVNDLTGFHAGHMIGVQWTAIIGYHVHGFRGRWGA